MLMPQPHAPETYVADLDRIPTFTDALMPMKKFIGSVPGNEIISPPPPEIRGYLLMQRRVVSWVWTQSLVHSLADGSRRIS